MELFYSRADLSRNGDTYELPIVRLCVGLESSGIMGLHIKSQSNKTVRDIYSMSHKNLASLWHILNNTFQLFAIKVN